MCNSCLVIADSRDIFYNKLSVVNYLSTKHDSVYLKLGFALKYELGDIIQAQNV